MKKISVREYEKILKNNISYDHLEGNEYNFYKYRDKPYSGMGFSDSLISENLNKLIIYEDGIEDGICREWYDNGKIKEEVLKTGLQNGYKYQWDEDGRLIYKSIVLDGWVIYKKSIGHDGRIKEEIYKNNIIRYSNIINENYYHMKTYYKKNDEYYLKNHFDSITEKRFKDTEYIYDIINIFEKNISEKSVDEIAKQILEISDEKNRNTLYDMVVKEADIEINDGIMLYNNKPYSGIVAKFIDEETLNFNMLYSLTECVNGRKEGIELIWDFEGLLNPAGIERYGIHDDEYCWWSKEILKKVQYFKRGALLKEKEWDNRNLEK